MEELVQARPGWIAVLGEVEGLRWVMKNHRMAFTKATASKSRRIEVGDRMILYVGRGAYHNPTRDESQLLGLAEVTGRVRDFPRPIDMAGRDFVCGCNLRFDETLPERAGVPVKQLVTRLSFVRKPDVWGQYFRSGLVEIPPQDLVRLANAVRAAARRATVKQPTRLALS